MNDNLMTWMWLIAGVGLMVSEFFLPGVVAVFLGAAAVVVAGLRWLGLLESLPACLIAWACVSVAFIIVLRKSLVARFPAESFRGDASQELKSYGTVVEVLETVRDDDNSGRVRFQGTSWPATSTGGTLAVGSRARLVYRDNLSWVVAPVEEEEVPPSRSSESHKPSA